MPGQTQATGRRSIRVVHERALRRLRAHQHAGRRSYVPQRAGMAHATTETHARTEPLTRLSKHLRDQGVSLYVPPLEDAPISMDLL
jgi:hypothetical protein